LYRSPANEHDDLVLELSDALNQFNLGESWLDTVPTRCGFSKAVDLAATALIRANKYAANRHPSLHTACMISYWRVIATLRAQMNGKAYRPAKEYALVRKPRLIL
jgi:hypothetical protein